MNLKIDSGSLFPSGNPFDNFSMDAPAAGAAPRRRPRSTRTKRTLGEDFRMDTSGSSNSDNHEKIIEMSEHNGTWKNSDQLWATLQNYSQKIQKNLKAQV